MITTKWKCEDLTVVITNWNYGMFLREAIESVLAQTVLPSEIVFADDGSTDNSLEIYREYMDKYPGMFRLVASNERTGLPANLRRAADTIKTEWVCFLAADDKFKPTYIERCSEFFESDPRLAILYSDMEKFGNWEGIWRVSEWNEDVLRRGNYINGHACFRMLAYRDAGGYRAHVNGSTDFFEDYYLWIDMCDAGKGYYGRRIPEPLVMYRRHNFGHRTDKSDVDKRSNL